MGNPAPRPKHLAKKLLTIREHLGLSQTRMGVLLKADISYHRLSEYEHNRRMPSLAVLLRYARVAGIPMEYIADDEVDMEAFKNHLARAVGEKN